MLSAEYGIGVRHGCFCAHPLTTHLLGITLTQSADLRRAMTSGTPAAMPGAVRASLGLGTTVSDIGRLAEALTAIIIDGPRWTYRCSPEGSDCWPDPDPRAHWTDSLHGHLPHPATPRRELRFGDTVSANSVAGNPAKT